MKYAAYARCNGSEKHISCTRLTKMIQAILDSGEEIRTDGFIFFATTKSWEDYNETPQDEQEKQSPLFPKGREGSQEEHPLSPDEGRLAHITND